MTLPGANSMVSVCDEETKDISPPHNTSNIVPQAKIDPSILLNNIHVSHNINKQNSTFLPNIHTSPFLVTKQRNIPSTRHGNTKSPLKLAHNRSRCLREKINTVQESPTTSQTLFNWLTEFRSQLNLDMRPCRYPSPSHTLPDVTKSFSDDQEVRCYCLPNPASPLDSYDLILSDHMTATSNTCYYTASPLSILSFDEGGLNGVTSVCRWVWEREMFYSLRKLSFFKQARQRKVFNSWTRFHSASKMNRVRNSLSQKLYLVRPDYQQLLKDMIIYLESICPVSSQFYTSPLLAYKDSHLKVFWMDLLETKSMQELKSGIVSHFDYAKQRIAELKETVADMLVKFADKLEQKGFFTTNETQRNAKFCDVILNRKHLHDLSCFIRLADLILHQYLREQALIGAATLLSLLHTSIEDAVHEGTFVEEDEFRRMVLELRLNKAKMSGQLQDISHGIIPVPQEDLGVGLTSRRQMLAHRRISKSRLPNIIITEQLPDKINKIVDDLRGPSPPLLRVSLELVNDTTLGNILTLPTTMTSRKKNREFPSINYKLRLEPSREDICQLFNEIRNELWNIANVYESITTCNKLEKYMKWFNTTSLFENPPFSTKPPDTPVANRELSISILPLLEKITPEDVNKYVELAHPMSCSSEEDKKPKVYRFKSDIYDKARRMSSRKVRIEEELIPNTDDSMLDNFEKSLAEYWDIISFDLERNLDDISIYCDAYQPYCSIINQCIRVLDHTSSPSKKWGPDKFGHYLKFAQSQEECVDRMVRSFRSGAFKIDTTEFYRTSKPYPQKIVVDMTQYITDIQLEYMNKLMEDIKNANFQLQLTISDVSSCANHLYFLEHMQHEINQVEEEYTSLNRYMSIIEDYSLPYPDDDKVKLLSIRPAYNLMFSEFAKAELRKENTIILFSELINKCLADISRETDDVKLFVSSQHFLEESSGYENVYLELSRHSAEVARLLTHTGELQRHLQQLLHQKNTLQRKKKASSSGEDPAITLTDEKLSFQDNQLRSIQKEIRIKQHLWENYKKWKDLTNSWYQTELSRLDIAEIQKQVSYFLQLGPLFESAYVQNSLWANVHLEVRRFDDILPILTCVIDPDVQQRLHKLLKEEINIHSITLEELIGLDLLPKKDRILQENRISVQERHSRELFDKITEVWSMQLFSLTKRNDVWLLLDVDNIISLIEDSIMNLNFIKSSKFIGPIKKEVEVWDVILSQMLATVRTWYVFQKRWSELETIFSSIEMRHELSAIFRDFRVVDKHFQDFSNKYLSQKHVSVKAITTTPGILEAFQSHIVHLERVSRLLDDYLENKRSTFGRLYFLSREELLQVICNPTDTSVLQPFLPKLFGSVQQLQLVSGCNPDVSNIHGVVSVEGEVLKLDRLVPVRNTTSNFWFANLLTSLREKVCSSIVEAHTKSSQSILEDWTFGPYSGQSILVSLFITWTLEVEMAIAQNLDDWSNQLKNLSSLRARWHQQIDRMVNTLASIKRWNHKLLLNTSIIILLTYFREVLSFLLELPMFQGPSDYNWCKVLRYYLDDPSSVWVEQFLGRFRYCNEYLGCSPRLVMTPLTERAFRQMSTAMHMNMGTAFFGGTGTGKTETVRDFSKAIGNICFSYSCIGEISCRMLSQYLSGICSSGTLCCFDDFHKLTSSVLNVVIYYMQVIKTCKDAKKDSVLINAREVPLLATSAYFVTMNYLKSVNKELYAIVLSTLRPCAMFESEHRVVAEVLLYSSGFTAALLLARKLSSFCQLAERNLSEESHYNFGMRSIKQVISLASERKKVFYINWGNVCFPLETIESLLLIRCIQDTITPRLIPGDQQLFHSLLSDHFPGVPQIFTDQQTIEKLLEDIVHEKKLEKCLPQIQKVIQLFQFIKHSTGIMLVGESGTGKTVCLQILARLLDMLSAPSEKKHSASVVATESGQKILTSSSSASTSSHNMSNNNMFASLVKSKVFSAQINAKAFSLEEFYGTDDHSSDDCLGIFPKILKSFLSDISPQEETVAHKRTNLVSKIEPREMMFEDNKVLYKPREDNDTDNSGIPLIRNTSFKHIKVSEIVMNKEVTPPMKKKFTKTKSSQTLNEDVLRKKSGIKKSGSFHNESEILEAESIEPIPSQTGKLSSYSKEYMGSAMEDRHQLPCEWRWIVFDGPVDTQWVDHLNPALDDTRIICLNNGERLKITKGIRFIFETESLQYANPSIVSRCSIVFLSEKDLGWKPIFNSWLNSLHTSIPDKIKTHISAIAYYSIPQALELISGLQNKPLTQIPQIAYVTTLCNIMTSLVYYLVDNKTFGDVTQTTSGRQWGHHAKSSSIVSSVSGDTHFSSGAADKPTLSLVFEQEEEPPDPFLSILDPELVADFKEHPTRNTPYTADPGSNSSLTFLQKNPEQIMNVISRLFLFSFVWSFGGPLDSFDLDEFQSQDSIHSTSEELAFRGGASGRAKFDQFVYRIFSKQGPFPIDLPLSTRPIFSYYIDLDTGKFTLWESLVLEGEKIVTGVPDSSYSISPKKMEAVFHQISREPSEAAFQDFHFVPTLDSVRTTFFTCLLGSRGYSVLLAGQHASGVSLFMRSALDLLIKSGDKDNYVSTILGGKLGTNEFENVFTHTKKEVESNFYKSEVKLFFDISASVVQQQIESQLLKRRNRLIGRNGNKLLLFLDDLNAPKCDQFDVSPCMELISSMMDTDGLYERKSGQWRWIYDVTTMGTYRLTQNSSKQLTGKFLRRFNTFHTPSLKETTIKHIFGVAISLFLIDAQFQREIILMADKIVSALMFLYKSSCEKFQPSTYRPHYVFNIRDLAQIFAGMQQCTPKYVKNSDDLINLFTHECNRVIHDRLVDEDEKSDYFEVLHHALRIHCKIIISPSALQNDQILFGNFSQTQTKLAPYQPLPSLKIISAILDEQFIKSSLSYNHQLPIFFDVAVHNIMRICRIMTIPCANMIMIGLPASGKRSGLSLASHLMGFNIVMPHKDGEYKSYSEFDSLVRQLYREAGEKGAKSCLYIPGRFLEQNLHLLSYVSYIITQGCTTHFFSSAEIQEIKQTMESNIESVRKLDSPWQRFVRSVNENFHVFISVSLSGRTLSLLCREYPDVISHCNLNYFAEWPAEDRTSIAMKFLKDLGADKRVHTSMLKKIAETCSAIYKGVLNQIDALEVEQCWQTYATTASFIEMVSLFTSSAKHQFKQLTNRLDQLDTTVRRFSEADQGVIDISRQLERAERELKKKENDLENLLRDSEMEKEKFLINRERFTQSEKECTNRVIATQEILKDVSVSYKELRPELEEALREIQMLKKSDIIEIRQYTRPPDIVQQVMTALCLLLQHPSDWTSIKQLLSDKYFIQMIIKFDKDHVSDDVLERLQVYINDPRFHPDNVDKISGACKSICKWMFAIEKYCKVFRLYQPRHKDYVKSMNMEKEIKSELKQTHDRLLEIEQTIRKTETKREKVFRDKYILGNRLVKLKDKLKRAHFLRRTLEQEQVRCQELRERESNKIKTILGDCLISSAGIAYLGPFPVRYRQNMLSQWKDMCWVAKIPVSASYSFSNHLMSEEHYDIWYTQGLPKDRGSIENAVLIEKGFRWPLIIDPQQLANKWIEQRERENNLVISDYANVNLSDCIAMAIENDRPLLIKNIPEKLPLSLDTLLLREDSIQGASNLNSISLFEKPGERDFRLYMTCNLPFPRFKPYVYIRTNVINFSISEESMEDMLLTEAVAVEDPNGDEKRTLLLSKLPGCYKELWALHDSVDSILQKRVVEILDNPDYTNALATKLARRDEIQIVINEAKATQEDINKVKASHGPIARRGSLLYAIACDLSQLNHMYHFSIYWFLHLYKNCFKRMTTTLLKISSNKSSGVLREYEVDKLLNKLTHTFYIQIGRGIFSKHLLPFSLTLCSQLLLASPQSEENSLTLEEWNFFLFGNKGGTRTQDSHNASSNLTHFLMPQVIESRPTLTSSSLPLPHGCQEITTEMWKRCEELETQLPQAFLSIRQFIILNARLWKQYMLDPDPFTFIFDSFNTDITHDELDVIQEERESDEWTSTSSEQTASSQKPILIPQTSLPHRHATIECDFQIDFLTSFHKLILIKELRKEALDSSVRRFITQTVGAEFTKTPVIDLDEAYASSSPSTCVSFTPILLMLSEDSTSCRDMVGDIEKLAKQKLGSHTMLSQLVFVEERVSQSFATLKRQAMRGGWVLCTNVHLQLTWLTNIIDSLLEMIRDGQQIHRKFRLWLITKTCEEFPISILHLSLKLRVESLKCIKSNVEETLVDRGAISEQDFEEQGAGPHWKRLLFSLCFFNAIIRCRNRYGTLGWNNPYDFSVRDFTVGKYILMTLMTDHSSIPWKAIVDSLGETCYGGRVTDVSDKKRLECILERYFNSEVTSDSYHMLKAPIKLPMIGDNATLEGWKSHLNQLPVDDYPEVLGLHQSADVSYNLSNNIYLMECLVEMNSTAAGTGKLWQTTNRAIRRSSEILSSLPTLYQFQKLPEGEDIPLLSAIGIGERKDGVGQEIKQSNLLTVLDREIEMYRQLIHKITNSIEELQYFKNSKYLMTVQTEELDREIKNDIVPRQWKSVCYPTTKKLGSFVIDLKQRCQFFSNWQDVLSTPRQADTGSSSTPPSQEVLSRPRSFWLAAFFNPHSFLTAIKQDYSRSIAIPLECISLQTRVLAERRAATSSVLVSSADEAAFGFIPGHESANGVLVHGLYLEGCRWDCHTHQGRLATAQSKYPINRLPPLQVIPVSGEKEFSRKLQFYNAPVYQTADRLESNVITHFKLPTGKPPDVFNLANAVILLTPPIHSGSK